MSLAREWPHSKLNLSPLDIILRIAGKIGEELFWHVGSSQKTHQVKTPPIFLGAYMFNIQWYLNAPRAMHTTVEQSHAVLYSHDEGIVRYIYST